MSKTKKQHYVPRSYLKQFAIPGTEQIAVFDKSTQAQRVNNIMDVAEGNRFYDYDIGEMLDKVSADKLDGIDANDIEAVKTVFDNLEETIGSTVEPAYAKLLRKIISKASNLTPWEFQNTFFVDHEDKAQLSVCLAFQLIRTKKMRDFIKDASSQVADLAERAFPGFDVDHLHFSDKDIKRMHIENLLDMEHINELASIINNLTWMLGINSTDQLFYTSDAPIVMIPHTGDSTMGVGLLSRGVEVVLPITPKLLLVMFDGDYHYNHINHDRWYIQLDRTDYIEYYNWYLSMFAHRCVFSSTGDFDIVRKTTNAKL